MGRYFTNAPAVVPRPPLPTACPVAAPLTSLRPLSCLGWLALLPWPLLAQELPAMAPLQLQLSPLLAETLAKDVVPQVPSFVAGQRITTQTDVRTVVEGDAEWRRHDLVVRADRLEHRYADNTAIATGAVRINRDGNIYEGPALVLKLDTFEGEFTEPRFSLLRNGAHGDAARVEFLGEDRAVAHQARYSTCKRPPGGRWLPDWVVSAERIEFDNAEDTATATNGVLRFKGVPVLAAPWISFPMSERRKSGVLPPTLNFDNQSGVEVTLPYYLNLAPNRDATLYPTWMSRRGLDLGGEYRYLERAYAGTVRAAYLASDPLRDERDRWATSLQHQQLLPGLAGGGPVALRLNLNRVSDGDYWRDFPRSSTELTQRLLARDAVLSGGHGPWSFTAGAYSWQTLNSEQDVSSGSTIVPPYDRVPSLGLRYAPAARAGWTTAWEADLTRFEADRSTNTNGSRALLVGQLGKTWRAPWGYVRPALQMHLREYRFDQGQGSAAITQAGYVLPTVSVDGGLFFDRETRLVSAAVSSRRWSHAWSYVHTPYRDQSMLPNYDSSAYDFNLATIFSANPYGGHDRIADVHAITLGATSRLLDPDNGAEIAQFGVAQRIRLSDQQVVLDGTAPLTERLSDVLFDARLQWSSRWSANGTVQFNPKTRESVRTTLGMRYSPGPYRVFNAAYRLQRNPEDSEQVDFGWQWPLADLWGQAPVGQGSGQGLGAGQWYSVGRLNYSVTDRRVVDLVAGLEYDGGCWIGRMVLERLQQSANQANQRLLFQLEFVGFSRLGSSPLKTLKDNIPRYQYLREQINPPSRFERYD